jgi:putative two-component system response regulator
MENQIFELQQRIIRLEKELSNLKTEKEELLDELEKAYKFMLGPEDTMEQILSLQMETNALNEELRNKIRLLEESNEKLRRTSIEFIRILGNAVEARDPYTKGHCDRLVSYSLVLGRKLGLDKESLKNLAYGGWLHDIGKIQIEDDILKKPGRLTPGEYERIKEHTIIGWRLVQPLKLMRGASEVIRHHHERFDGTGYPDGLSGGEIPITARILCLVDVFDALTTERPYKKAFDLEFSLDIIQNESGKHFDPMIVKLFFEVLDKGELILGQINIPDELFR